MLAATGPLSSVLQALDVFAARAPCDSATAVLALFEERATGEIIHPTGVLVAARAAGASSAVELVPLFGRTGLVPVRNAPRRAALTALAARRLVVIGAVRLDRLLAETQPPDCRASVVLGNCRQSENRRATPPGLEMRRHSPSQSGRSPEGSVRWGSRPGS